MANRKRPSLDQIIDDWFFSPLAVGAHTVWFALWFLFGLDINLLTMIVSLEAIYLTQFVGIAQKHQHAQTRAHLRKER